LELQQELDPISLDWFTYPSLSLASFIFHRLDLFLLVFSRLDAKATTFQKINNVFVFFLYYISCKENKCWENFKSNRKSLVNFPFYSHPEIWKFHGVANLPLLKEFRPRDSDR
jgi:hypothetical protein